MSRTVSAVSEPVAFKGRLKLTVLDPGGRVVDEREGDNVVCTTGYTAIAAALSWSGIQDQAANLGITSPTYLTPLWGAVGSGSATPVKADTQLATELGRVVVSGNGAVPATSTVAAQTTWLFYFPNPASNWTVAEAGVFANATSAANTGAMLDHWAFSPTVPVPTTNTLVLEVSFLFGP
jgi:hypothetical protein